MNNIGKKIIFALVIIVLGFFIFFSYPIIRDRYFSNEDKTEEENNQSDSEKDSTEESGNVSSENVGNSQTENQTEETSEANDPELKKLLEEEDAEEEKAANETEEEDSYVKVSSRDCQNKCQDFSDGDELKYCQEYCGLSGQKENPDCADLEGLEIDYCFKTLAISKRDYAICDKIKDAGIQKTCRNRITEDIIDSQK